MPVLDSADSRLLNVTSWGLKRATLRHNDRPEFRMIGVAWRVVVEGLIAYSVVVGPLWGFGTVGYETPMRRVAWYLAGVMIAPDHQQFLARHAVSPWWIAVNAAVAHVQAFDNGKAYRRAARRSSRSLVGTWGGAWVLYLADAPSPDHERP